MNLVDNFLNFCSRIFVGDEHVYDKALQEIKNYKGKKPIINGHSSIDRLTLSIEEMNIAFQEIDKIIPKKSKKN